MWYIHCQWLYLYDAMWYIHCQWLYLYDAMWYIHCQWLYLYDTMWYNLQISKHVSRYTCNIQGMSISSLFTDLNQSYLLFMDSWTLGYFPLNWIFFFLLRWILFLFFGHSCILNSWSSFICLYKDYTFCFPLCYLNLNVCL
jgi:hypothetical protein